MSKLARARVFGEHATFGETLGPAMKITDQADADEYFAALVEHTMRFKPDREEAEKIVRTNLGSFAGYYDEATRERVERLYKCSHPEPDDCVAIGVKIAGALHKEIRRASSVEDVWSDIPVGCGGGEKR
jgi:hypothetical protein